MGRLWFSLFVMCVLVGLQYVVLLHSDPHVNANPLIIAGGTGFSSTEGGGVTAATYTYTGHWVQHVYDFEDSSSEFIPVFYQDYILLNGRACGLVIQWKKDALYEAEVNHLIISNWVTEAGAKRAVEKECVKVRE